MGELEPRFGVPNAPKFAFFKANPFLLCVCVIFILKQKKK